MLAGDDGFTVNVSGNTDLKGGKIASTDQAVSAGKNSLTTGSLTLSDIANKSEYQADGLSLSVGAGNDGGKTALNGTGIGFGHESGSDASVTRAGISGLAGDTTVRSDQDSSNALVKNWDGKQLEQEVQAQMQITEAFSKQAALGIGTYATKKLNELNHQIDAETDPAKLAQLQSEAENWKEGGAYRTALHAAAGALGGGLAGAAGATTSALAMPAIAEQIDKMDAPEAVKQALAQVTAGALGVAVGGTAGLASAVNVEANNRQLHISEVEWIQKNKKRFAQQQGISEIEAEKRLAQQGFRQVQNGVGGQDDAAARVFLSQAKGMLSADGNSGSGYMFYATPDQKANLNMYASSVVSDPNALAFYGKNDLKQPTQQQIKDAATKEQGIRDTVGKATVGAAGLAAVATLPPALSFCLSNPVACNQIVINGAEFAAGDALGPASLAVLGTTSAVKAVRSADEVNAAMKVRGWEPAWASGTPVIETTLQPGTKVNMIVDAKTAEAIKDGRTFTPGGWATFDDVNLVAADMRQKAAITGQFKKPTDEPFYVIQMEITQPVTSNIGFVGKQTETTGGLLRGGGTQVQFDETIKGVDRNAVLKVVSQPKPLN